MENLTFNKIAYSSTERVAHVLSHRLPPQGPAHAVQADVGVQDKLGHRVAGVVRHEHVRDLVAPMEGGGPDKNTQKQTQ